MDIAQKVTQLVEEKISDRPELFLVDVRMLPNNKLIIQVDGDEGINIADCAAISRHVGFHLEEDNVIETAYNLEVSSPGVGEPLKLKRQYHRNIGRDLEVKMANGEKKEGKLIAVNAADIVIAETPQGKGKKGKAMPVEAAISFEEIVEAKVLISFK